MPNWFVVMPNWTNRHTSTNKSIGQLRSGVLRTGKLKEVNPKSVLSRHKALKSSQICPSFDKLGESNSSLGQLPLAGRKRKLESGTSQDSDANSKYHSILAHVKPERKLRIKRIQPKTLIAYASYVELFLDWCKETKRRGVSGQQADKHMAIYFNALFDDGEPLNTASYTLFGWIALRTVPRSPERDLMPLSRAALTAWRGVRNSQMRVGLPPQVIYHFAAFCVAHDEHWAAAAVLLQYDLYARPSEMLEIRGRDLVPPVRNMSLHWGVIFGNADHGETLRQVVLMTLFLPILLTERTPTRFCKGLEKFFFTRICLCSRGTLRNMKLCFAHFQSSTNWRKVFSHLIVLDILVLVSMLSTIIELCQKFKQEVDGLVWHQWTDTRNLVVFCLNPQSSQVP